MKHVIINEKGTQRVLHRHPWVFRSDIVDAPTDHQPGAVISVQNKKGQFLGQAFFNPLSQISLRFLTNKDSSIDIQFLREKIRRSIHRRKALNYSEDQGIRLIYGESDFLPGLIVDRYRDVLVFQTLCAGIDLKRELILKIIQEETNLTTLVERNDVSVRELEGLLKQKGIVSGEIPQDLEVREGDNFFSVDPLEGQKTGLFLDQSENHVIARRYASGRALDIFTYQGGFALPLSQSADEVTAVDSSAPALKKMLSNAQRNQRKIIPVEANGFDYLRELSDRGEKFDTIVLDPPPFMKSKKVKESAPAGYKEINLRAMKLLKPDGVLITASCSQNFTPALFAATLHEAARDARREIQILEVRGAASDHPVLMNFPESHYLQCWIVQVI
ncbi:MAG: class I SAM-dependent rRNA methyltransferase [Deltaproteobacteria bacterium]|nr:MAG: class I SAM-dependent rRNA methyltransferase [Deltaproteobacteria bacterium]